MAWKRGPHLGQVISKGLWEGMTSELAPEEGKRTGYQKHQGKKQGRELQEEQPVGTPRGQRKFGLWEEQKISKYGCSVGTGESTRQKRAGRHQTSRLPEKELGYLFQKVLSR